MFERTVCEATSFEQFISGSSPTAWLVASHTRESESDASHIFRKVILQISEGS